MKLIDKDALVAEIEGRKSQFMSQADSFDKLGMEEKRNHCAVLASNMHSILSFIDTLEVKEVDLEEVARNYLLNEHLSPLNELMHKVDLKVEVQYHKDIENAYKAGFNFALKAQKGE